MGPEELASRHRRLASVLSNSHVEADRLARHWAAAGELHTAAGLARSAAPQLRAAGATRRAYDCFELALASPPADALAAAELHEDAALTAARIGEYESMRAWIQAADRFYRDAGQPDRAVRMVLDPSLDYLPVSRSERIRDEPVEGLLLDAREQLQQGDPERTGALLDAAIQAARERDDGMALARTARVLALTLGEFERADALLEEAAAFADVASDPGRRSRILTIRGGIRTAQGDVHAALELFRRAVAISRREPEAVYRVGEIALGDALAVAGRVAEGAALLAAGGGAVPWAASISETANGLRRFEHGDPDGLDAIVNGVDALMAEMDLDPLGLAVVGGHLLGFRAVAEVHGGRTADAVRTVDRLEAIAPEPFSEVAVDLAYVLARVGGSCRDGAVLQRARRRATELARMASGPAVIGASEAVRGFTAACEDRTDEAVRHLQGAAEHFERAPRALLAAELWCDVAQTAGPGTVAGAALARAERICGELGLDRVAARATEMREALAQLPPRLPGALAELTSRERDVVLLAAEGLSNREIGARLYLSDGTVRNYLSTAFTKLGVSRRAELARLVAVAELVARD
jgi:DNA-binding CsgD family transcriptional regulator